MDTRLAIQCTALAVGGATAALTLGTGWIPLSTQVSPVAIAIAAAVAALLAHQPRWLEAAGIAGLVLLAVGQFVHTDVWFTNAGAALLLGCLAGLAKTVTLQAALIAGVIAGSVFDNVLWTFGMPARYVDYAMSAGPDCSDLILIAITAIALLSAAWSTGTRASAQVLAVCVGLPIAVLLLAQLPQSVMTALGVYVVVIAAAFVLPGRAGLAVLAGGALATTSLDVALPSAIGAVILCGLVVAGLVLGIRWPNVALGIGVMALAAIPLLGGFQFFLGITVLVAYLAAAFALASSLEVPAPVLLVAITAPLFLGYSVSRDFGWTAYTPLTSDPLPFTPSGWLTSLVLATYAVAAYLLSRRSARR